MTKRKRGVNGKFVPSLPKAKVRNNQGKKNHNERILVKLSCLEDQMKREVKKLPEKFTNIIVDDGDIDCFAEVVE